MTAEIAPETVARKRAEHLVVGELLKWDVLLYPLTANISHAFKARTPTGRTIEMRVEPSMARRFNSGARTSRRLQDTDRRLPGHLPIRPRKQDRLHRPYWPTKRGIIQVYVASRRGSHPIYKR